MPDMETELYLAQLIELVTQRLDTLIRLARMTDEQKLRLQDAQRAALIRYRAAVEAGDLAAADAALKEITERD